MAKKSTLTKSAALYERAKKVMPGGCSRNTILRKPHPVYVDHAAGCRVSDIEGVTRIDFANNVASLIHGHAHPAIISAVNAQLTKGTAFSVGTEVEIEFAEHICARNAGFEKIRFVNSGTEAVMSCLKAARAFTGRAKIAKVEGSYHGLYDYAEVSQTASPANWGHADNPASVPVSHGTPPSALDDVVVIPFNEPERAIEILDQHGKNIACVLLDLLPHRIGVIPASKGFVKAIDNWTKANGALMVCDEVITFRSNYGGAQQWYDFSPGPDGHWQNDRWGIPRWGHSRAGGNYGSDEPAQRPFAVSPLRHIFCQPHHHDSRANCHGNVQSTSRGKTEQAGRLCAKNYW